MAPVTTTTDVVEYVYEYQYQEDVCLGDEYGEADEEVADDEDDDSVESEDDDAQQAIGAAVTADEYNETGINAEDE